MEWVQFFKYAHDDVPTTEIESKATFTAWIVDSRLENANTELFLDTRSGIYGIRNGKEAVKFRNFCNFPKIAASRKPCRSPCREIIAFQFRFDVFGSICRTKR